MTSSMAARSNTHRNVRCRLSGSSFGAALVSWLKAYLQDGIEGLKDTPPVGRTNRKEQSALTILQPVLARHPSNYGYLEAGWSTNLLVDYLLYQGLEASESTVKRALKRSGWVYKRFAKTVSA